MCVSPFRSSIKLCMHVQYPYFYSSIFTDVYRQRQFTYTGKGQHLLWDEYGIELQFPSLSSEVQIDFTVSVISTVDNKHIEPESSKLVSAVYEISANRALPEPVTVRLQHCVPIHTEEEASAMSFVVATTKQGPPYRFEVLSGGLFRCGSSYGEIKCSHFSRISIIQLYYWLFRGPFPMFASVYYIRSGQASLVVTRNLSAHINVSCYCISAKHCCSSGSQ